MTYRLVVTIYPEDTNRWPDEVSTEMTALLPDVKKQAERSLRSEIYSSRTYGRSRSCPARMVDCCIYRGDDLLWSVEGTRQELISNAKLRWTQYRAAKRSS